MVMRKRRLELLRVAPLDPNTIKAFNKTNNKLKERQGKLNHLRCSIEDIATLDKLAVY